MSQPLKRASNVGVIVMLSALMMTWACSGQSERGARGQDKAAAPKPRADAVQDVQTPRDAPMTRPEQQKNEHDQSKVFAGAAAPPASTAFKDQPDQGKVTGFDFSRDPLGAK